MKKTILLLLLILTLSSCKYSPFELVNDIRFLISLKNNNKNPETSQQRSFAVCNCSDSAIYACVTFSDSLTSDDKITLFSEESYDDDIQRVAHSRVDAYNYKYFIIDKESINRLKNNEPLNIFLIKESVMNFKTWDEICQEKLFEAKKEISREDLRLIINMDKEQDNYKGIITDEVQLKHTLQIKY